jgi:hypothetical protein
VELRQAELPATGRAGSRLRTELTGVQCEAPCDPGRAGSRIRTELTGVQCEAPCDRAWDLADGIGGGRDSCRSSCRHGGRTRGELLPPPIWGFFYVAIIVYRCCNNVLGMLQTLVFTM